MIFSIVNLLMVKEIGIEYRGIKMLWQQGLTIDMNITDSDGNQTLSIKDINDLLNTYEGYLDVKSKKVVITGLRKGVFHIRKDGGLK